MKLGEAYVEVKADSSKLKKDFDKIKADSKLSVNSIESVFQKSKLQFNTELPKMKLKELDALAKKLRAEFEAKKINPNISVASLQLTKDKLSQVEGALKLTKSGFDDVAVASEKTSKTLKDSFLANMTKVGASLGLFLGAQQVVNFGKEAVLLASKIEGVRAAFQKLNDPKLLNNLREATRNTVADLVLMQTAVKAENFRIPMETLVKGLEFAQKKATQTGQSVDYMVDSLITGIGRKSLPVLDNLQLSVVEIQEEVKKVGDFGKAVGVIIERELKKMGDVALTTADRLAQLNTKWENLKVIVGEGIIDVFSSFERLAKNTYGWLDKIASLPQGLLSKFGIDISDKALGITKTAPTTGGSMKDLQNQVLAELAKKELIEEQNRLEKEKEKTVEGVTAKITELVIAQQSLVVGSKEHLANLKEIARLEESLDPIAKAEKQLKLQQEIDNKNKAVSGQLTQSQIDGSMGNFADPLLGDVTPDQQLEFVKEFEEGRIDLATEANRIIGMSYGEAMVSGLNQSASIAQRLSNVLSLGAHTFVAQMAQALTFVNEMISIISSILGLVNTFSNPVAAVTGAVGASGGVAPIAPASNNAVRALNLNQQNSRPIEIPVYVNGVELTRQVVIPNIDDINKTGFKRGNS